MIPSAALWWIWLGDLPEEGQHPSVQIDRVRFTVLEVDDRRISRLKAEILPDESYPEPASAGTDPVLSH